MPLASIPRRALARTVDLVIGFVPAIAAAVAIPWIAVALPVFILLTMAGAAQDIFGTARWGKSAGKALLGIRVVNERNVGRPTCSMPSALVATEPAPAASRLGNL